MFLISRPSARAIDGFLRQSEGLPLSHAPVGLANQDLPGFDVDELIAPIGYGRALFLDTERALHAWKHFDLGWIEVFPQTASIREGAVVAVLMRHLGFWSLNGCRIVYTLGDGQVDVRCGFAYGTLPNHAEMGEELFEIRWDPGSDEVTYRLRAASRPRALLARAGRPIVRALQARCRRESAAALRAAVTGRKT